MHLFYSPDIVPPHHTLSEEESRHCVRVLRMVAGDRIHLTDGRGNMYAAEVEVADPKRCLVRIVETMPDWQRRGYSLTMAVAPTKNIERYEWFLEKATEIGCDRFIPIECARSERRSIRQERAEKVVTSAAKQSLKAFHPAFEPLTDVRRVITKAFGGVKLIAHCGTPLSERRYMSECAERGEDVLILIGPEGDFSPEEIRLAVDNGFREITLGDARMRTETAAIYAVIEAAIINR